MVRVLPFLLGFALVGAHFLFFHKPEIVHAHGVTAPGDPVQTRIENPQRFSLDGEYLVTPLAEFRLTARVLSRRSYFWGKESRLCPVDLALGWGPMSDSKLLSYLDISQRSRRYLWRADELPVPVRDIQTHSANMHLIPASPEVRKTLLKARKGHLVELSGKLVRINAKEGWYWQSSLTRNDTGDGACEVVWVEKLALKPD